jgi:hypothetical protein
MPQNLTGLNVKSLADYAAKPTVPTAEVRAAQAKAEALAARPSTRGGTPHTDKTFRARQPT